MTRRLLTIIVPTYNRADSLASLLDTLARQLADCEGMVHLIVGDNASVDGTSTVIEKFRSSFPGLEVLRHATNVGPDENFCRCIARASTRFFWIIGDDDLPKAGIVARVLRCLADSDPDLLYLGSTWQPDVSSSLNESAGDFVPASVTQENFAGYVNVWVTFISGMVVNRERLLQLAPTLDIRRFTGTNLVQLGWVLPLLVSGERFLVVRDPCILATSGNTGGYKLVTVFATNFPRILDSVCGRASPLRRSIMRALAWNYVPGLLWMTRFGNAARFSGEDVHESLAPLRESLAYRLVIMPVLTLPRMLALPFWIFSRACGRVIRLYYSSRFAVRGRAPARSATL